MQLTRDHTADLPDERARVAAAGGAPSVRAGGWRVGAAGLQVTRSVGDADLKPYGVTAEAEAAELALQPGDAFLIAATDGLWDRLSNEEAVALVQVRWRRAGAGRGLMGGPGAGARAGLEGDAALVAAGAAAPLLLPLLLLLLLPLLLPLLLLLLLPLLLPLLLLPLLPLLLPLLLLPLLLHATRPRPATRVHHWQVQRASRTRSPSPMSWPPTPRPCRTPSSTPPCARSGWSPRPSRAAGATTWPAPSPSSTPTAPRVRRVALGCASERCCCCCCCCCCCAAAAAAAGGHRCWRCCAALHQTRVHLTPTGFTAPPARS